VPPSSVARRTRGSRMAYRRGGVRLGLVVVRVGGVGIVVAAPSAPVTGPPGTSPDGPPPRPRRSPRARELRVEDTCDEFPGRRRSYFVIPVASDPTMGSVRAGTVRVRRADIS